jgi:hypothetical protein
VPREMTTSTMSRRGFIKTASAFAGLGLLPSWKQFTQRRQIDLRPFCDDWTGYHWNLAQPFAQDGLVYATDARILCRTTLADAPQLSDQARLPAASKLPWWEADDRELTWRPWPKLRLFSDKKEMTCPVCWGRGCVGRVVRCAPCDGDGTIACQERDAGARWVDFGDEGGDIFNRTCDDCQGSGYVSPDGRCGYCGGTGDTNRPALQRIDDLVIAGHYDNRIRALGQVEYSVLTDKPFQSRIVRYRGDGFEGLLMPIDVEARGATP